MFSQCMFDCDCYGKERGSVVVVDGLCFMETCVSMSPELVSNVPAYVYEAHCPSFSSLSKIRWMCNSAAVL